MEQLQTDYKQVKPTHLLLQQQLETAEREVKRLEDELLFNKNRQAEMHDHENLRFYRSELICSLLFDSSRNQFDAIFREMEKHGASPSAGTSIFMDDMAW